MPSELAAQMARTYVVAFAPIFLAFAAIGFWRFWRWLKRKQPL